MALSRKIAYIDLSSGRIETESIPPELRRQFLGGRGLDIYLLYRRLKQGTDALDPANVLVVSAGLLAGTLASTSGRTHIAAKSPITGYLGGANLGGFFAPELRRAGFDHVVISGKATRPSFIFVDDGKISIRDASIIWGQSIPDTQEILRKRIQDDEVQAVCIGPAGEKLVRFATAATRHQGATGRTGMGAVFGSKNLKAIVTRGRKGIRIAHPREALEYDQHIVNAITSSDFGQRMQTGGVSAIDGKGDSFDEYTVGMDGCFGCQLHCRRRYVIRNGPYSGSYGHGPGYGCARAWATVLGDNPEAILTANYLVNSYGLDSLETANLIEWAMRLCDEGILASADTDGIQLLHGDSDDVNRLIGMVCQREGLGSILAEGGDRATETLGRGSSGHLRQVGGMADVFDDMTPWQTLGVATATRGCDHLRFLPASDPCRLPGQLFEQTVSQPSAYEGRLSSDRWDDASAPWLVHWTEICGMVADMLGICDFHTVLYNPTSPGFEEFSKMIALNTGLEISPVQVQEAGETAFTLERMFNLREGYTEDHGDHDGSKGARDLFGLRANDTKLQAMLYRYYEIHGWNSHGVPKPETLKRLGLAASLRQNPANRVEASA